MELRLHHLGIAEFEIFMFIGYMLISLDFIGGIEASTKPCDCPRCICLKAGSLKW